MEERIRASLKGKHLTTLREELKGAQTQISKEEVDSMPRKEIIACITLLRNLNQSEDICKQVISSFDRNAVEIRDEDADRTSSRGRGSQSDVFGDPQEGRAEGGLVISKPILHSLTSLDEPKSDASAGRQAELLRLRFEQEVREKEWKRDMLEQARIRKEERDEKERIRKSEIIEREARENSEKAEREQKRVDKELRETAEKAKREQKRVDKELRETAEKAEREQKRFDKELREKAEKEELAQQRAIFEARVLRESEERSEKERKILERDLNSRLKLEEDARLDKIERDRRYEQDKLDKQCKELRYESRLQRANDLLKGRIAKFPESAQQITIFFRALDYLYTSFNVDADLRNPILVPF